MSTPTEFNASAATTIWDVAQLPPNLQKLYSKPGVRTLEFTLAVQAWQKLLRISADGKLGSETLQAILAYQRPDRSNLDKQSGEEWSPLCQFVRKTQRKLAERSLDKVRLVIVHTTGTEPLNHPDPLRWAIDWYTSPTAYTSHYLIDGEGNLIGLAPEEEVALHAGIGTVGRALYHQGPAVWQKYIVPANAANPPWKAHVKNKRDGVIEYDGIFPGYAWWTARWQKPSPLNISTDPNIESIGIDLLPGMGETYNDKQKAALDKFCADVDKRFGRHLPVVCHSDTHPMQRSDMRGAWDPRAALTWEIFQPAPKELFRST